MPPGGLNIRWPDSRSTRNCGCTAGRCRRRSRSPAPTGSTASSSMQSSRASASSPPANPISTCGRRSTISASAMPRRRRSVCAFIKWRCRGRWSRRGCASLPRGSTKSSSSRRSAALIEPQLKEQLYGWPADRRPRIVGKFDEAGDWILPSNGELAPSQIARVIGRRLAGLGDMPWLAERLARLDARERRPNADVVPFARTPYFCSGCPHNTSTRVPEGSRALAGIGCHYLSQFMDRNTATFTQMGGEGASWIGQAPFTETAHVFANIGDGTYTHSGILAIRAAVAAGVTMTYKVLFNDAVAMTGGQPLDGGLTVPMVARQLAAEGVHPVVVVTDEPDKYPPGTEFPARHGGAPPRRTGCGAARVARDEGRHRDRLRPDLRRREAPPPQARPLPRPAAARLYQRSGLRRLRRLLGDLELPVGGAGRDRVRPQAGDRPVELQQGFLLPEGVLPELCHGAWRQFAQARHRQFGPETRSAAPLPEPLLPALVRALRDTRHRGRRYRRRDDRCASRHGGASGRQGRQRARPARHGAEGRRGHEPCAHRRAARCDPCGAHRRRRRRPAARLRPRRVGEQRGVVAAAHRPQPRHRQQPRDDHRRLHPPPGPGLSRRPAGPGCRDRRRRRQCRVRRGDAPRDRAPRRFDRHQPVHARLCLSARARAGFGGGDRARDRAQRRRGRCQSRRLSLGQAGCGRPGAGRGARRPARCAAGEPSPIRDARRGHRAPRRVSDPLPERRLRPALCRPYPRAARDRRRRGVAATLR